MRLAHDRFRVVTGGGMGMRDKKIFTDALPADGSAQLFDATNSFTTIGLWGPRARDILAGATSDDVSPRRLPVPDVEGGRHQRRADARVADLATSASSAGRSTSRSSRGSASGTRSGSPGRPHGHGAGRDRDVRGDGAAREGLSGARRRARARLRPGRGGHGPADGQGRGLRGPRGLPAPARGGRRRPSCAR